MRRSLVILLTFSVLLCLAACKEASNSMQASVPTTAPTDAVTETGSAPSPSDPTQPTQEQETTAPTQAPGATHTHSYTTTEEPATCTETGLRSLTCACGDVISEALPALGHAYALLSEQKAGCTYDGSCTYSCTRCHHSYDEAIASPGHVFGNWQTVREPANGQDGEAVRSCQNCSATETKILKNEDKLADGTWGTMTWVVFKDGTLVVTGSGAMQDGDTDSTYSSAHILPGWCDYKQQITTILLDDRITVIGNSNFKGLSNATSIHLPASLQEIRAKAFSTTGLGEGMTFPNTLTTIGSRAFEYYKGTTLTLPASCTRIEAHAFAFAPNLKTADLPGVTSFGEYVFTQCKTLERVTLSTKLTHIPTGLFKDCWMLNEICIPDSVQSIGDYAFAQCFCLRSVKLGVNSDLVSIGKSALPYGLTTFTIPKNVTSVGTGNFTHAWEVLNLSSATVPFAPASAHAQLITSAADSRVTEKNGWLFFTTADGAGILIGCSTDDAQLTVPSQYTYKGSTVTVTGIANYAIRGCLQAEKIVLPSTLQFMENYSIFFCPSLNACVWLSSQQALDNVGFSWNKWTWSNTNVAQAQQINVLNPDGQEFYYIKAQGTCGAAAVYKLYGKRSSWNDSVLSIEGSGAVTDTLHRNFSSTSNIKYVVINPGITELGNSCLTQFLSAEFVYAGTAEQWAQVTQGYSWGIGQRTLQFIPDFFL